MHPCDADDASAASSTSTTEQFDTIFKVPGHGRERGFGTVHARRTCASLLVDLDVHPRIAMAILRHADFSITMEVYAQVSSKATREALKRLGQSLDGQS
jgi:integrase